MDEQEFKRMTRKLALDGIRFVEALPRSQTNHVIGRQLLRSVTSVGANYRASCRGRSPEEIIAKLSIVEEEADETLHWLELLVDSGHVSQESVAALMRDTNIILAMTVNSKKTLKARYGSRSFATKAHASVNREA